MNNTEETWETGEVISWLINDEGCYDILFRKDAKRIRAFVVDEHGAPEGLYESMDSPPASKWSDVDWDAVEEALAE